MEHMASMSNAQPLLRKHRSHNEYSDGKDDLHKAGDVLDEECEKITEDAKAKTEQSAKSNVDQIFAESKLFAKSNIDQTFGHLEILVARSSDSWSL